MTVSELTKLEDDVLTAQPPPLLQGEPSELEANLFAAASGYFEHYHDLPLDSLLSALDEDDPCGPDLRGKALYSEINEARRADDPSLPRGDWIHELKRADWGSVSQLTVSALASKSKDLQVSAWLLESEIRLRGLAGVAPVLTLIEQFLRRFWQQLNPPSDEIELRANIFYWIDQKIALVINQVPLAQISGGAETFAGVDIDRALTNERLVETGQIKREQADGPSWKEICSAARSMVDEYYLQAYWDLFFSLRTLEMLVVSLDEAFSSGQAPSLHTVEEQLEKAMEFVGIELDRRGLLEQIQNPQPESDECNAEFAQIEGQPQAPVQPESSTLDRQQAYRQLSQIADYLARVEPHSPVPYLLKRAIEWGRLNTAELYQQLFLQNNGQISLFEILGIKGEQSGSAQQNDETLQ